MIFFFSSTKKNCDAWRRRRWLATRPQTWKRSDASPQPNSSGCLSSIPSSPSGPAPTSLKSKTVQTFIRGAYRLVATSGFVLHLKHCIGFYNLNTFSTWIFPLKFSTSNNWTGQTFVIVFQNSIHWTGLQKIKSFCSK